MVKQIESASKSLGIDFKEHLKKLLVVEPLEVEKDIKTTNGITDAVRANIYVVKSADGSKFEAFEDVLIFPRVLQSQTRRKIGSLVVGRLVQGVAKSGQNPPWELAEPTEKDLAAARGCVAAMNTVSAADAEDEFADEEEEAPVVVKKAAKKKAAPVVEETEDEDEPDEEDAF